MFFFQIVQVYGDEKYLTAAKKCCDVIWKRGFLQKGYGLCHGIAGNGYAFLALYNLTKDCKYLYYANKVERDLNFIVD